MIFSKIAQSTQSFFAPSPPPSIQKTSLLLTIYLIITALAFLIFLISSFGVLLFASSIVVSLVALACLLLLCVFSPCLGCYISRKSSLVEHTVIIQTEEQPTTQQTSSQQKETTNTATALEKTPLASQDKALPSLFSRASYESALIPEEVDDTFIQTTIKPRPNWL